MRVLAYASLSEIYYGAAFAIARSQLPFQQTPFKLLSNFQQIPQPRLSRAFKNIGWGCIGRCLLVFRRKSRSTNGRTNNPFLSLNAFSSQITRNAIAARRRRRLRRRRRDISKAKEARRFLEIASRTGLTEFSVVKPLKNVLPSTNRSGDYRPTKLFYCVRGCFG